MALCAYCQAETELYDGGDVPICIECSDAREARRKPPAIEQDIRTTLFKDLFEATLSCAYGRTTIVSKPPAAAASPEFNLRDALFRDLAAATRRVNDASMALDELIGQFKGKNDIQRMQNASEELEAARKEMARAHNRLNDFLSRGIIPEDLKRAAGQ